MEHWKYPVLGVSFILHWALVTGLCTYMFWGRPAYDKWYIFAWVVLISHWFVLGHCIISLVEKKILYDDEEAEDIPFLNPSMQFFIPGGNMWTFALSILVMIMYVANIAVVAYRNTVHPAFVMILGGSLLAYFSYWRYQEFLYMNNKYVPH